MENDFSRDLKNKMDRYVHLVYKITRNFPKEEIYGATSQLRRSVLSVILKYIESFARIKSNVKKNFWEISYGSLKESSYLLKFSLEERYCCQEEYDEASSLAD